MTRILLQVYSDIVRYQWLLYIKIKTAPPTVHILFILFFQVYHIFFLSYLIIQYGSFLHCFNRNSRETDFILLTFYFCFLYKYGVKFCLFNEFLNLEIPHKYQVQCLGSH